MWDGDLDAMARLHADAERRLAEAEVELKRLRSENAALRAVADLARAACLAWEDGKPYVYAVTSAADMAMVSLMNGILALERAGSAAKEGAG